MLRSKEMAEDILQSIFLKLAGHQEGLSNIRKPRSYLFSMARNEAMDILRKRKREKDYYKGKSGYEIFQKKFNSISNEEVKFLNKAVAELPVEQREIIVMKIFGEMRFREIARIFNISLNTVASRYRYGLEKIRDKLGDKIR